MSVIRDPALEALLTALHARSDAQAAAMRSFDASRTSQAEPPAAKEATAPVAAHSPLTGSAMASAQNTGEPAPPLVPTSFADTAASSPNATQLDRGPSRP